MIHAAFVLLLRRTREFLGSSCALQLRVLSRACNEEMQEVPLVTSQIEDYLSSVALFEWARDHMGMPVFEGIYEVAASCRAPSFAAVLERNGCTALEGEG
jgi:hypothetical protein